LTRYSLHVSGHAAEQYVCYDLAKRGFRVVSTPFEMAPYDILADCSGRLIRVQVKSTAKPSPKANGEGKTTMTYHYNVKHSQLQHSDIVAFVALDIEKVVYRLPEDLGKSRSLWISTTNMKKGSDIALFQLLNTANM
jgi:hypothetical protein